MHPRRATIVATSDDIQRVHDLVAELAALGVDELAGDGKRVDSPNFASALNSAELRETYLRELSGAANKIVHAAYLLARLDALGEREPRIPSRTIGLAGSAGWVGVKPPTEESR